MTWTKEPPTMPGWYWYRVDERYTPFICEIITRVLDDTLCIKDGNDPGMEIAKLKRGSWAGPIPKPSEVPE